MKKLVLMICVLLLFCSGAQAAFRPAAIGDLFHKGASGYDVRSYGAKGDGSTDDEPAFTLAIAAAAGGRLIIPEATTSYKLSSNVTVPAGVTVVFQQGGLLLVDNAITFTVNGTIEAGRYQIFSGAGSVVLADGAVKQVWPDWWGGTAVTAITDGDTTPSVNQGNTFQTGNTGGTTIAMFDGGFTGQVINVLINDAFTTFDFTSTNLKGNGGADWTAGAGDALLGAFDGTDWYCLISKPSNIDISADTNLAVTAPIVLTDDTVSITVAKDIVAGAGLTGGEDNVLPGAEADVTITVGAGDGVIANADEIEVYGLVASDGTPNDAFFLDAAGKPTAGYGISITGTASLTSIEAVAGAGVANRIPVTSPMMNYIPGAYYREADDKWQYEGTGAADQRYTLQSPARLLVDVDDTMYLISAQTDYDLSVAATWDTTAGTDYTVAANRAGVDFYIYAIQPASGTTPLIEISANSSAPDGYTTADSRKIGGFHCLCVAVGTIGGHTLTDFVAGDILPMSVWDYDHRPVSEPEGMVYSEAMDIWVDIYLVSGTGASTLSVYGGTISDVRTWADFNDDGAAVKKRLLWDNEFQSIAAGSNEETNNAASADPVTAGGHSDTAGRRMISNIGVEDACGAMSQWLLDTSYRYDGGAHTHTSTVTYKASATGSAVYKDQGETNFNAVTGSSGDETVNTNSVDPAPAFAYYNLPGSKGSLYKQGTYGTVQLLAGGDWAFGANAGSRARHASIYRWSTSPAIGARLVSESR